MVAKQGFNVFWWWFWNDILLHFKRPLEKFERPLWFLKTVWKKHWLYISFNISQTI